ncbi:MAG: ATP-binding protein [Planctomycetota bacterium]|jgi:PAS domain S-box-containing protein|nr:ATP-binding protein [Planctomycetota bacterium]
MRPRQIATKLIAWFLLISLVPLFAIGLLEYYHEKYEIRAYVANLLQTISSERARQIDTYIMERQREVTTLSRTPSVIDAVEHLNLAFQGGLDSPEYQRADKQLRPFLTNYRDTVGCEDLFLISARGDALFSVNQGEDLGTNIKNGPYKESELAKVFDRAYRLLETGISDFAYYPATNEPAAFIAAPILQKGIVSAVVVLQLNNDEVYELVRDYTGLGESGETIIGSRDGDKAVFLAPVRHDPHSAFRRRIEIGSTLERPLQQAVQGKKNQAVAIDYRGEEVLAVWRYLPSCRWGMVVKMDTREAFAPIADLRNRSVAIGVIATVVVLFSALVVSRTLSKPITSLTESARSLAAGDLTARADVSTNDEIDELAAEFNLMAQQIEVRTGELKQLTETLEERVAERTAKLEDSIHDTNQAREKAEAAEQSFRMVIEASPAGILTVDAAGCILMVNPAVQEIFGYSEKELLGQVIEILVPEAQRERHVEYRAEYAGAPKPLMGAGRDLLQGLRKDGTLVPVEIGLSPLSAGEAEVLSVILDVTERRKAEETLRKYADELLRSNESLQQFAYAASHDLQEPLRAVQGYSQVIANHYQDKLDERGAGYVTKIVEGVDRMKTLISGLLRFSRIESEDQRMGEHDSSRFVVTALKNLETAIQESGAEIIIDGMPGIRCDPAQLTHLFQNLIGNAIKFRGDDRPKIEIGAVRIDDESRSSTLNSSGEADGQSLVSSAAMDLPDGWLFRVQDNGIGIDPQYSEKIFEVFKRLHTRRHYEGTGIGLAMCRRIAERHGGRIWVESQPGEGSTFYINIPDRGGQG